MRYQILEHWRAEECIETITLTDEIVTCPQSGVQSIRIPRPITLLEGDILRLDTLGMWSLLNNV